MTTKYPDFHPIPSFTVRLYSVNGPIVSLAIAGTMFGICPVFIEHHGDHPHPLHENHSSVSYRVPPSAVSSTTGNVMVSPPTGSLGLTGYAPTVLVEQR
jgi:hypothetical protein